MSNRLPVKGTVELTIIASDKIAIFSRTPVKIYSQVGYPNRVESWTLLQTVAADTEYVSAAFAGAGRVRIEAGAADVLYATGTAPTIIERRGMRGQGTPGVLDNSGALTSAMILSGLVTSAAAAVTANLPTGTVLAAAVQMNIGDSFDWAVVKVGANSFTVTAAAGHTIVGVGIVITAVSALFRTCKTAATTFVTYRLT